MTKQTHDYSVLVEPVASEDGGGFTAVVPDLPGCTSDGETAAEALANIQSAIAQWIDQAHAEGRTVPPPSRGRAAAKWTSD
jgi:antitoxin HicB